MNKVTIENIYLGIGLFDRENILNIEIVPRKMIEMIIEKCDRDIEEFDGESNIYGAVRAEARNIKNYALSLLEKFEEEPKPNKEGGKV